MIEIEDENCQNWTEFSEDHSESWASLSEPYNHAEETTTITTVSRQKSGPEYIRTFRSSHFEDETERTRLRQRERDFDIRRQINRNRGEGSGGNHPRNRDSFSRHPQSRDSFSRDLLNDSFNSDPWYKDTWNDKPLNRESHNRDLWSRDSYADRPRVARRPRGISPLRSPVNRNRRPSIMDMDNSNSFRFTNLRRRDPSFGSGQRRFRNSTWSSEKDYTEKPCRRLHLSSEDDNPVDNSERLQQVVTDETRLARKEKDIAYGKNTEDYKLYIEKIPRGKRSRNRQLNPRTPDKNLQCSRRSWDAQVKIWKIRLHTWADQYRKDHGIRNEGSQKSLHSEVGEFSECIGGDAEPEQDISTQEEIVELPGIQEEIVKLSSTQEENVELPEEDDVNNEDLSFLDTVDITTLNGNSEVENCV